MMRTVFSLGLLILPGAFVSAADQKSSKPELNLATLVRTHGFVNTALVQDADEATVGEVAAAKEAVTQEVAPVVPAAPVAEGNSGEVIVESSISPVPMADDALPQSEGEIVYEAPIRNQTHQHHYTAPKRQSSRGGVFSELMELERRKNAWLKRTFLGR